MDSIITPLSQREASRNRFANNFMKHFSVAEWKTLLALAYNGELAKYEIKRQYNVTYATVDRVIRGFERIGWVRMSGRAISSKGTQTKKYALTEEGMLWLFSKIPSGCVFSFDPLDQMIESELRADPVDIGDISYSGGIVGELRRVKCHDDICAHILKFDRYVPRIARNNESLFPVAFERWSELRGDAQAYFPWVICSIAIKVLLEYNKTYDGLIEKFGTLDKVLAYFIYQSYLQRATEEGASLDSEFAKRILHNIEARLNNNSDVREVCYVICGELEAGVNGRLSFVKQLSEELGRHRGPQNAP
jgi:hypothetical protein